MDLDNRLIFRNVAVNRWERTRSTERVGPRDDTTPEIVCLVSLFPERDIAPCAESLELVSEPVLDLPCRRLLKRHLVPKISLLQIDTVGFDFETLNMVDLAPFRPS